MDELLLRKAQHGDPEAFEQLITPLEQLIWRICWHYTGNRESAEDCGQETMIRIWRSLDSYRGDCALESWVYRIAANCCMDYLRKKKRDKSVSMEPMQEQGFDPADPSPGTEEQVVAADEQKRLREALLVSLVAVVVLSGLAYGGVRIARNIMNSTEAPFLIGETEENAIRLANDKGLVVETVRQSDPKVPAGVVILQSKEYQYPMKRGERIVIFVSTGPEQQGVPALVGKTLASAQTEAEKYGFTVLVTQRVESDQALGTVLEQDPAAGDLEANKIIMVVVSGSVNVPRFIDMTRAQALNLARETGFNDVQIVEHVTQEESKFDRVADQVPKEGERVLEDTQITLAIYVSPGEAPQESPAAENDNTN